MFFKRGLFSVLFLAAQFPVYKSSDRENVETIPSTEDYLKTTCSNFLGCESGGSSRIITDLDSSCCIRCNCDASCIHTHSCCPQTDFSTNNTKPYKSALTPTVCRNAVFTGEVGNIYVNPEYEFVETCPTTTADETQRLYCENITMTEKSTVIAENTPVYDVRGNLNYKNIHCARCNGVAASNLDIWQAKLACTRYFDQDLQISPLSGAAGLEGMIEYNQCSVSFNPPDSVGEMHYCYNDVIVTCNVTGEWATYNQTEETLCQTLDLIYVSVVNYTRRYKNIFCAMCNGERLYVMFIMACPHSQTDGDFTQAFTSILQFSAADIEFSTGGRDVSTVSGHGCLRNYLFDPLMDRCMPLYCSAPLHIDVTSPECILLYQNVINGRTVHAFNLVLKNETTFQQAQLVAETVFRRIKDDFNILSCLTTIFYQTDALWSNASESLSSDLFQRDVKILAIYLSVYVTIPNDNPRSHYERYNAGIAAHLNHSHVTAVLGPESFDVNMLEYKTGEADQAVFWYEEFTYFKDGSPSHYLFQNPYNDAIILGHMNNRYVTNCQTNMYTEDFLECPAFIYESTRIQLLNRDPNGLSMTFKGRDITIPFNEFKSVNSTVFKICSQAVLERVGEVQSSKATTCGRHCTLYSAIFAIIFFVMKFLKS